MLPFLCSRDHYLWMHMWYLDPQQPLYNQKQSQSQKFWPLSPWATESRQGISYLQILCEVGKNKNPCLCKPVLVHFSVTYRIPHGHIEVFNECLSYRETQPDSPFSPVAILFGPHVHWQSQQPVNPSRQTSKLWLVELFFPIGKGMLGPLGTSENEPSTCLPPPPNSFWWRENIYPIGK